MVVQVRKPAQQSTAPNFLSPDFYVAGGGFPEGDYALEFEWLLYGYPKNNVDTVNPKALAVKITAHDLNDPSVEPREQYYGAGKAAGKSFMPDPDTGGKSLKVIPNGPSTALNNQSNWAYFVKSLYDSGMPMGYASNDFTTLDGVHAHMHPIPEPESRKTMQTGAATGDAGQAVNKKKENSTIMVVSSFIDGGKPWEGGGGVPERVAKPAAKKVNGKAATATAAAAGQEAADLGTGDPDFEAALVTAVGEILEGQPTGCSAILFKTSLYSNLQKAHGDDMANSAKEFYSDTTNLGALLALVGFRQDKMKIVPAA